MHTVCEQNRTHATKLNLPSCQSVQWPDYIWEHQYGSDLQVTLLHLHTVKQLVTESQVQHAVDVVEARVLSLYEKLTVGQWRLVRQTLCRFFQDRRIKVPPPICMHNEHS